MGRVVACGCDGAYGLSTANSTTPNVGRVRKAAVIVFLLSLALRGGWASFAHVTPVRDFRDYNKRALTWMSTGQLGWENSLARRTPAYPAFLAGLYQTFGYDLRTVAYAQALLGALSSALIVLLAGPVLSSKGSLLAGLLHTVWPTSVAYVPILASENLAIPLMLASLLLLARLLRGDGLRCDLPVCGSGLLFGLLILTRPAALFMLPAWLLLSFYNPRQRKWRLRPPLILIAAIAMVLAPWFVRNHRLGLGPLTIATVSGVNIWMANNDKATTGGGCKPALWRKEMTEKQQDREYRAAAVSWIYEHPGRYLALCRTRALHLLGTEPDGWPTTGLVPSRENNEAIMADRIQRYNHRPAAPELIVRARACIDRNRTVMRWFRVLAAPLLLVAFALALGRWRGYAIVVLPASSYVLLMSLYYVMERFRELYEPLLMIPLAALLVDLLFGTAELGVWPSRKTKALVAALAIGGSVVARASKLDRSWYDLSPTKAVQQRGPKPVLANLRFEPIDFARTAAPHFSRWKYRTQRVTVTRTSDGLRCAVVGSSDTSGGQYGGIRFSAIGFKALRLEMTLLEPENIDAVIVMGYDESHRKSVSWRRRMTGNSADAGKRATIVIFPGVSSDGFVPVATNAPGSTREIHVVIRIKPNTDAGFILHRAEIAY